MEALAAVGLAGNIVQFIDFSCKLFDQTNSIYRSLSGASQDTRDLDTITRHLQDMSVRLQQDLHSRRTNQGAQTGRGYRNLEKIAKDCEVAASELLSALQSLKATTTGSRWSSFTAALLCTWKKRKVKEMEDRLDRYRQQITLELAALYNDRSEDSIFLLQILQKQSEDMNVSLTAQIEKLRVEIRQTIGTMQFDLKRQGEEKEKTKDARRDLGSKELTPPNLPQEVINSGWSTQELLKWVQQAQGSVPAFSAALAILDSLRFDNMEYRYSRVPEAHTGTTDWMFSDRFSDWLRSNKSLFWITGKPGSGKSTMMKRLIQNSLTTTLLHEWSGSEKPIVISYFYWINGSELLRSQEGLLRCLLYHYLRQCPEVIASVFPDAWKSIMAMPPGHTFKSPWTRQTLLAGFTKLSGLDTKGVHLCAFIDGLDEYKGDHVELIDTIYYLSRLNMKLCVASRPWNVFEQRFEGIDTVYMQDFNKPDIQRYVNDKLFMRKDFQKMLVSSTEVNEIGSEISEKSHGVFLWVYLVVRSLIEGLSNRDPISLLRKRLNAFPSDLFSFFRSIFESMDDTYRMKAAHMFLVTMASGHDTLTTLTHWYLDEQDDKPQAALNMEIRSQDNSWISECVEDVRVRINGRCKGLLEVRKYRSPMAIQDLRPSAPWSDVDFLHRTVRDFFYEQEMSAKLDAWRDPNFIADEAICKAVLAEFKTIALGKMDHAKVYLIDVFMISAVRYEKAQGKTLYREIEEFRKALSVANMPYWERQSLTCFTALAMTYDLCFYVKMRSEREAWSRSSSAKEDLMTNNGWSGKRSSNRHEYRLNLSCEMFSLVHSIGPPIQIHWECQLWLCRQIFPNASRGDVEACMKKLAQSAIFTMHDKEFESDNLQVYLDSTLGPHVVTAIIKSSIRPESTSTRLMRKLLGKSG